MATVTQISSPNFNDRDPSVPLRYIVLHYTGMPTGAAAIQRMCDPAAKVSAHYMIEEDGQVIQLVDESKRAWHAGHSAWGETTDMNSASLGIELVNPGHQNGYRPFPAIQISVLKVVMKGVIERHAMNPKTAPLAHAEIAPERKEDPGEFFPWRELADSGLGLWPTPQPADYGHADDDVVQDMLRTIGYPCPPSGFYDRATRSALLAFQRRYEPDNLTGTPERETIARLRALARMLKSV